MRNQAATVLLMSLLMAGSALAAVPQVCDPETEADSCVESVNPERVCAAVLEEDPYRLSARISLCDVYVADEEMVEANVLVDDGLRICGSRSYVCGRLQVAKSNLTELDMPANTQRVWEAQIEGRRRFCFGPSNYDTAIKACKEALVAQPEDPALHKALGDKYRAREMTAAALIAYGTAISFGARDLDVTMVEAELEREAQAEACLQYQDLPSCDLAVLPGADDEFALQQQRGELLFASDNRDAALEAFSIAQSLQPDDSAVAERLLVLFDDDSDLREDPSRHTARAYALLAVDSKALNYQALCLHQSIPEFYLDERIESAGRHLFNEAWRIRQQEVDARCLSQNSPSAINDCERLKVPCLSDLAAIDQHIAEIREEQNQLELARLERQREEDLQRAEQQRQAELAAAEAAAAAAELELEAREQQVRYDNSLNEDEMTY